MRDLMRDLRFGFLGLVIGSGVQIPILAVAHFWVAFWIQVATFVVFAPLAYYAFKKK